MNQSEAYHNLLVLFSKITDPQMQAKLKKNPQSLGREMALIGMDIALFGSDEVVQYYIDWRASTLTGDMEKILKAFSILLLSMRENIHGITNITNYETMLDTFIVGV